MLVLTAHFRFTLPVNPPEGVMVIVEVLPAVAPGLTSMAPLLERASAALGVPTITWIAVWLVRIEEVESKPVKVKR